MLQKEVRLPGWNLSILRILLTVMGIARGEWI